MNTKKLRPTTEITRPHKKKECSSAACTLTGKH